MYDYSTKEISISLETAKKERKNKANCSASGYIFSEAGHILWPFLCKANMDFLYFCQNLPEQRAIHVLQSFWSRQLLFLIHADDPHLWSAVITIFVVCTPVPTFQNLAKTKQSSSEYSDRYWRNCWCGRVDHWWHACLVFSFLTRHEHKKSSWEPNTCTHT